MSDLSDDYAGAGFGRPLDWGTAPAVLDVVKRKAQGKNIEPTDDVEPDAADDLLAALAASLA